MSSAKCLAVSHIHKSHYALFIWFQFSFTDSMIWFLFTMMTLPNGNIFRVAGPLCEEFTGWWFQTPSRLLWRHCNDNGRLYSNMWRHDMETFGITVAFCDYHQITLQRRHNERDGVSNHQLHDCLLNRLFRRRSKQTSKSRVTGLCAGNSPVTGEFSAQRASNAENVSIWWRHHAISDL